MVPISIRRGLIRQAVYSAVCQDIFEWLGFLLQYRIYTRYMYLFSTTNFYASKKLSFIEILYLSFNFTSIPTSLSTSIKLSCLVSPPWQRGVDAYCVPACFSCFLFPSLSLLPLISELLKISCVSLQHC